MENVRLTWESMRTVLQDLGSLLKCEICKATVNNPCTLGGCEHYFCKCCIEDLAGIECPVCHIPSHAKDVQSNRQIANAVTLCSKISSLLYLTEDDLANDLVLSPKSKSTNEAPSNLYTRHMYANMTDSPPVASRTRTPRQTKRPQSLPSISNSTPGQEKVKISKRGRGRGRGCRTSTSTVGDNAEDIDNVTSSDEENCLQRRRSHPMRKPEHDTFVRKSVKSTKKKDWGNGKNAENSRTKTTKVNPTSSRGSSASVQTPKLNSSRGRTGTPAQTTSRGKAELHEDPLLFTTPENRNSTRKTRNSATPNTSVLNRSTTDSPSQRIKRNAKGETSLHVAAIKGDLEKVRSLLAEGASPNVKDNAGWSPLHEAVNHGYIEIAEILLDHGALINMPGMDNDTPIHDAVQNNQLACVLLLVKRGANLMSRNIYGKTPLDLAKTKEMKEALKFTAVPKSLVEAKKAEAAVIEIQQVVVLATGLTRDQKIKLQKCCSLLYWKMVEEFSPEVTHVVTSVNNQGMCPRTMKYLQAILSGKWIINFEWVDMCIEYKERICEEAFEVPGTSTCPDSHAPQLARLNFQQQCPRLLEGCHFYLQGDFEYPTPSREELQLLIRTGGGVLLTREIKPDILENSDMIVPYHAAEKSTVSHFILHDRRNEKPCVLSLHLASVPVSWLLDSIAQFKPIPFH